MDTYKHYIRLDPSSNIIGGFSDAFEQPRPGDILLTDQGGRQFELRGQVNPPLTDMRGIYLYRYTDGQVVDKTPAEIQAEADKLPKPEPQPTVTDILNLLSGVK